VALIGVFDSGVGGLSILDEALRQLPQDNFIYLADSANAPYGEKSADWITLRSLELCRYLVAQGCEAIVVACNTATAEAIAQIRLALPQIPIIGVEPGIKPAAMQTENGIVGVLATQATLNSDKFNALLATLPGECQFIKQAGAGLVPLIEAGQIDSVATLTLLEQHLTPIRLAGADTLVLGCTHYPFLSPLIRKIIGNKINLIDTGDAVIKQLARQLLLQMPSRKSSSQAEDANIGTLTLITSGDCNKLLHMSEQLLQSPLHQRQVSAQQLLVQ